MVHHDYDISRLTGVDAPVSELNFEELPLAQDEISINMGIQRYALQSEDDARIPLLRDVFKDFPEMPMNIDMKGSNDEAIQKVYDLIVEFQREDITFWGDMNENLNLRIKEKGQNRGIRTFSSIKYTFLLCLFYFLGILQFIPIRHHSVWYPFFGRVKTNAIAKRLGNKCKHRCCICLYSCLTYCMKPMFWHLRRRGVMVIFWNIDSKDEFQQASRYSVDGMLTDVPSGLRRYADEHRNRPEAETPLNRLS